ncbi:NAD-dependent epimerase/dehydratase family protein [Erwinia pyrifoliae]|uniref:NAD-dependent epimerase/dehydratase family protein n=1 Tax=Erwinia pyrifoliae TaxID=79967 RepID=UPI0021FFFF83|nr:NAD-dependent epimerase/dehydratase family protein [Erwinia pyrifoliae]MCT2386076.1 NAD-dependent epimerase/dehydratase family protein [Erwinia pyrifoliae]UWS29920.1 NAD-dependent epimerase/dehydratase family protein [Erwinia pyrifoliae]UXK12932.1 NAD-dependent epimerase/dehydratase family protein [Erwinia pyrifoliae]
MKKILIVGATGFIGKKVADYLIQQQEFDVIRYTRRPHQVFFSCELGDSAWQEMVKSCVAIINCSGVGLAKIKQQRNANETIARQLVESLPDIGKKYHLLHLSTVKAFNVHQYADAYSSDKHTAEQVLMAKREMLAGEILRIPAVFGQGDANLMPLLRMAQKGRLPEIQGDICRWHCISNLDIAHYVYHWLNKRDESELTLSYLLSKQRFSVNDLIKSVNHHVHGKTWQARKKKLFYIKAIYKLLTVKSYISSGFRWSQFPSERFADLFQRNWEIELSEKIAVHTVNFSPDDIWNTK